MSLALLKQRLAEILDVDRPASPGLATGIAVLDGGLGAGGIPRGRLTEVRGALGSGKTTLVRRVAERAVAAGVQVAYVDATRTLAPRDWAHLTREGGGLWVVRPADPARGAWCADVLLRSGAFGLVVLDGAPPLPRGVAVRLTRLARESDAALVVVGEERPGERRGGGGGGGGGGETLVGSALRLRVEARPGPLEGEEDGGVEGWRSGGRRHDDGAGGRRHARWRERQQRERQQRQWSERHRGDRRFVVAVEKGGIHQTVEVSCAIAVARRLCAHPEVPDRRGVGRGGARDAGRGARGGGSAAAGAPDTGAGRLSA